MSAPKIRWGILSTAEIARKNWKAISNSGNAIVAAVASRDPAKSRKFIAECQAEVPFDVVPRALGSYEELIASPDIDAIYIPLPTGLRKEWVLRAAAGKHVLCEKPCAPNLGDLNEMIAACRKHAVQFMDGVMFMHSRRLDAMRQVLDDGSSVGNFRRIQSAFSFRAPESFFSGNIRAHSGLEPQGCLGDLGWYCLRFTLWATRWRLPRHVTGRLLSQNRTRGQSGGGSDRLRGRTRLRRPTLRRFLLRLHHRTSAMGRRERRKGLPAGARFRPAPITVPKHRSKCTTPPSRYPGVNSR